MLSDLFHTSIVLVNEVDIGHWDQFLILAINYLNIVTDLRIPFTHQSLVLGHEVVRTSQNAHRSSLAQEFVMGDQHLYACLAIARGKVTSYTSLPTFANYSVHFHD